MRPSILTIALKSGYFLLCLLGACMAAAPAACAQTNVIIVVYDGVYLLDAAGPLEVFHDASIVDSTCSLNICTVSPDGTPVRAHTGLLITPDHSLSTVPRPDILVIPGGDLDVVEKFPMLGEWIRIVQPSCRILLTVCTGAFIAGKLGLLDSMRVTTWHGALKALARTAPACTVVPGVRWTDNGAIVTTAGISAGIDGSLHVVSRLCGADVAARTAAYMDYEYWTSQAEIGR